MGLSREFILKTGLWFSYGKTCPGAVILTESASKVAQEVQAKAQQVQEQVNATPAKDEKPKKGSK